MDPYVKEALDQAFGFSLATPGHTLEDHYYNLWKYDKPIVPRLQDADLDEAIAYVRALYRLEQLLTSHRWNKPAGWGKEAIRRAVLHLNWWLEGNRLLRGLFRYHPDLAWTRTHKLMGLRYVKLG